jgi:hypothetical protein
MKPLTFNSINCPTGNCRFEPAIWAATKVDVGDLEIQDSSHPNVMPFTGTLLLLDEASDQPPHGSDGHQILVPTRVAKQRLNTLPGMAINYQADLEGHNPAKKVGVITQAAIEGNKVKVKGLVWKKDFPEAAETFKRNRGRLGMSMELGDVYVRDKDERVWNLEDFHFTGATVLLKDHAAYSSTELAASRYFVKALAAAAQARGIFRKGGKPEMAKEKDKKSNGQGNGQALVLAISAAVEKGVGDSLTKFLTVQGETNKKLFEALDSISASQEELVKGLHELALSGVDVNIDAARDATDPTDDASDATDATVSAGDATDATVAGAKDPTDATDATDPTDATVDAGGTGDLDPTNVNPSEQTDEGSGSTPGDLNPGASKNAKRNARQGAGDAATKAGGKQISRGIAAERGTRVGNIAAAAKVIRDLRAQIGEHAEENRKLRNRVKSMEASLDRFADRVERRSISPEISALIEKAGYDVRELMASKQRLSVVDVDNMLASAGVPLDPTTRAAFKNQLLQAGLMEQGQVARFN